MSELGIFCTVARTELKGKVKDVSDDTLRYLNYAITQAYKFGLANAKCSNNLEETKIKNNTIQCECGLPISKDKIKEAVLIILKEWRNTNFIKAGGFQDFLLRKLSNDDKLDF